jgi:hypothetical protein
MNCPECRKKLWYWSAYSRPLKGILAYACQNCKVFYSFEKVPMDLIPTWQGVKIMRVELSKRGFETPPLSQRAPMKASPRPGKQLSAHPSRRGVG